MGVINKCCIEADYLYSSTTGTRRQDTSIYHGHSPPAVQSTVSEGLKPFQFMPSARKDTHEHLLSPPMSRDLNVPAANWRAYPSDTLLKSNIGANLTFINCRRKVI